MDQFPWKVITYKTGAGSDPVADFIRKQRPQARSKITQLLDLLACYGNHVGLPYSKALGNGMYELRVRGKEEIRIFYCFWSKHTVYLLHGFKKQTQQTPIKELHLALKRKSELTNR